MSGRPERTALAVAIPPGVAFSLWGWRFRYTEGMDEDWPLVEELASGGDAWSAACRLAAWPHLLFLDSAEADSPRGRYSYVSADPLAFVLRHAPCADPFAGLRLPLRPRPDHCRQLPPFLGGFAGLLGYGLGRCFERLPLPRHDEFRLPDLALAFYDWVISFDHQQQRAWLVCTGLCPPPELGLNHSWGAHADWRRQAQARREAVRRMLEAPAPARFPDDPAEAIPAEALASHHPLPGHPAVWSNFSPVGYLNAVRRAVEYVHAGDCFQVNLSQRLLAPLREAPLQLYARLRQHSPAPFAAYWDAGEFQVLSASPERFLQLAQGVVETRPIKGTRPRGERPEADAAFVEDLRTSPKDRAENVMIVDLLRNDLGRVCEYGSIEVTQLCQVESYRQVHHLVSAVRGCLRPGQGVWELLRATFPGGSVTGAPKVRAMEIIAELEPTARGPYCGSLGFVSVDGESDWNILIRTMTTARGWVQFPVGGGVVADSDPQREYEETLHKAAGMLRALAAH